MEKFKIEKDIKVLCVTARSFPEGVEESHRTLHSIFPPGVKERRYFGISSPDKTGRIIYKAAAEQLKDSEEKESGLESFTIKSGEYLSIFITDFHSNVTAIGKAFDDLIHSRGIDPEGYCLEYYYHGKDVRCMVPLK